MTDKMKKDNYFNENEIPLLAALHYANGVTSLGNGLESAIPPYFLVNDNDDQSLGK